MEKKLEAKIYSQSGKEAGSTSLPASVFGVNWNADLVHQVVVSMESNARESIAHTKNRGEVSGGGKKPWRQKGTGRARHGSTRSPIWVHGGVAHGPRNDKDYSRKVNRKMKAKALYTILSKKFRDGELLFVDSFAFSAPASKEARGVIDALGGIGGYEGIASKRKNAAYIATAERNENAAKSFRNFGNVGIDEVKNVNPLDLLKYKYVVIENPETSIKFFEGKLSVKTEKEEGARKPAKKAGKPAKPAAASKKVAK